MDEPSTETVPSPPVIGSTSGEAGQSIDEGKGRIFPCSSCGADFEFHIGVQRLKCPFCGFEQSISIAEGEAVVEQDLESMLARLKEIRKSKSAAPSEIQQVRCESCAALVQFHGTLTSDFCPYCGSPIQRSGVHQANDRVSVDGVLPFLVDPPQARAQLSAWLKSRWFLPGDLKKTGISERFHGVYLPYWTFDALTANRYRGERGEDYFVTVGSGKSRRTERRTRWYPASGSFQRFFDDVLTTACSGFSRELMQKLEPWPLRSCQPFRQEILAGFFARTYDLELEHGFADARERIVAAITSEVRRRIGGDRQRVYAVDTRYDALSYKHLLLPVWLLAYRYRRKSYELLVNAATGEVQGQRPYSLVKIFLLVIFLALCVLAFVLVARG